MGISQVWVGGGLFTYLDTGACLAPVSVSCCFFFFSFELNQCQRFDSERLFLYFFFAFSFFFQTFYCLHWACLSGCLAAAGSLGMGVCVCVREVANECHLSSTFSLNNLHSVCHTGSFCRLARHPGQVPLCRARAGSLPCTPPSPPPGWTGIISSR